MDAKYRTLSMFRDDADYITQVAKKYNLRINDIFSIIAKIIKDNELILFQESPIAIYDTEKLIDEFRKKVVKENNRILGFYIETDKRIKSMYNDLHYLLSSDEKEKNKKHPFWSEYELQNSILKRYLNKKYFIKNDDDLYKEMLTVLNKNEVDDYFISLNRTRSKRLSNIR